MTEYERGFADGERQSFKDRANRVRRSLPEVKTEYGRGWIDGYTPRSLTWAVRSTANSQDWWQLREVEAA
jgi:hypothetical protein